MQNGKRKIRVSSRALGGERLFVTFYIYDDLEQMREEAAKFRGLSLYGFRNTIGVCQDHYKIINGRYEMQSILVRLWTGSLSATVVSHEVHHATTALYGRHIGKTFRIAKHLTHYNEPFAYLFSDIMGGINRQLWHYGYYNKIEDI